MVSEKTVSVNDLVLNTENYRFESVNDQLQAINIMVQSQNEKLFNLAQDIDENGLNPNERIIVIETTTNNQIVYTVLEGNRRLVAIKLMNNPNLITDVKYTALKGKFKQLKRRIKLIDVNIYDDEDKALHWIKLKHGLGNQGVATEMWDPEQRDRFKEKTEGYRSYSGQIIDLVKNSTKISKSIKEQIPSVKFSTLERMIGDPSIREMLGLEIKNKKINLLLEESEVLKGLSKVIVDTSTKSFTVNKVRSKSDRQDYIDNFPKKYLPDKNKIIVIKTKTTKAKKTNKTKTTKSKKVPKRGSKLIPNNFSLSSNINKSQKNLKIYNELKSLDVEKYTNATAVLLRVFVELSVEYYLNNNNLVKSNLSKMSKLTSKINIAINDLTQKGHQKNIFKGIETSITNPNNIISINTMHAYVHNAKFSPVAKDLLTTWDNIQDFMTALWS